MIKQVVVDTTGGKVVGPAWPIEVLTSAGGLPVEGKLFRVVQITDADIAAGRAKVVGGRPIPVVLGTSGLDSVDGPAQQVYVAAGSLSSFDPFAYTNKFKALSPLGYWPQGEASGTIIVDESGNGRNGVYRAAGEPLLGQPGIGDGRTSALYDATNDFGNVFSASLQSAFNPAEGALVTAFKVSGAGVWTDGLTRRIMYFQADANNRVRFEKTVTNNQLAAVYIAGGTNKTVLYNSSGPLDWLFLAMTWSKSADQMKFYVNGVQIGATQTGLGTWVGSLAATTTELGASDTSGNNPASSYLQHSGVFGYAMSGTQAASLAVVS